MVVATKVLEVAAKQVEKLELLWRSESIVRCRLWGASSLLG